MAFHVVYVAGGELDKVKNVKLVDEITTVKNVEVVEEVKQVDNVEVVKDVEYVKEIKNFAQLSQPYNKMKMINIPAMEGCYDLEYTSPGEPMELLSFVVTCSGYGENDYYNLWVNNELWFDTWFPTEIKEGLFIGTSSYVYKLEPHSKIRLRFVNISGTSKKLWLGIRMLKNPKKESQITAPILDVNSISVPVELITPAYLEAIPTEDAQPVSNDDSQ